MLPLAFATAGRHIKATYFITLTYSINQFLEALNVCDSITNQQIDTAILLMPLSCLFHNAAALIRRGPVYLSAFRSCDHIYSAHEPLCSPVSQQQIQLSLVVCKTIWQSDQRLQGQLQVCHWSYVHVRMLVVNVRTQVCSLPSCMYVRVTAPSCNSISKQSTRGVMRDETQRMDPLTMMRPVVMGSLQPWHSSPNLVQ